MSTGILLKEKKLLVVFVLLILFTLLIGLVGILQIQGLNERIEDLGRHHLKVGEAVLGMRIKNTHYAMEIRSYIFWRIARYQNSLQMTDYVGRIAEAEQSFRDQLKIYRQTVRSDLQKGWGDQLAKVLEDLILFGKRIVTLADKDAPQSISPVTQDQLMIFEKRIYDLDQFLNDPMGRANLEAIQEQISLAKADKEHAILFLCFSLAAALVLGTLIVVLVYRQRIQERMNRQKILNRMMDVEETERKKLSTAVHDEMGQDLSALMIRLGLLGQRAGSKGESKKASPDVILRVKPEESLDEDPSAAPQDDGNGITARVEECRKIVSSLIKKSHNIAFLLRPPDLDDVGLAESLEALLLECKHMTGMTYDYRRPDDFPELSPEYSLLFYRISQELLTNMAKHAKARHVSLQFRKKNAVLELAYSDDGRGFDYHEVLKNPGRRREDKLRLGLIGLKERVELLDGTMHIDSMSGRGTKVMVQLPT